MTVIRFAEAWATPDGRGTCLVEADTISPDGRTVTISLDILHELFTQAGYVNISDYHEDVS